MVETGATSISRRKPNSRSQTIEMPAKAAVNSTDIESTPGNRKVLKSTPPVPACISEPSPLPRTKRNSSGWITEEMTRVMSRRKRIISRSQTTSTARISWPRPPLGTVTGATEAMVESVMIISRGARPLG